VLAVYFLSEANSAPNLWPYSQWNMQIRWIYQIPWYWTLF